MKTVTWCVLMVAASIFLAACSKATPETPRLVQVTVEVTRPVEVTRLVEATRQVEVTRLVVATRLVEATRQVEITRLVEVAPKPTPSSTPLALVDPGTAVQHERWEYSVAEVRRADAMKNSSNTKYAGGQYVVVFLRVKNLGSLASKFSQDFLAIEDKQGRVFKATESLLAHQFYETQNWYLDDLQPGGTYLIPLAFDVAKDAQNLMLRPTNSRTPAIRLP